MRTNPRRTFWNMFILLLLIFICEAKKRKFQFEIDNLNDKSLLQNSSIFDHDQDQDQDQDFSATIARRDNIDIIKSLLQKNELVPKRRRLRTEIFRRLFVG